MTIPAEDPKITIKTIIDDNISVVDDQGTPASVSIEVRTEFIETAEIEEPTIVIAKEGTGIEAYSVGYALTMLAHDYSITCHAMELKDATNVILADSLLNKMNDEIERIFTDRTLVVRPKTDISIIQYLGGAEDLIVGISPRIKIGQHLVRVRYQR